VFVGLIVMLPLASAGRTREPLQAGAASKSVEDE